MSTKGGNEMEDKVSRAEYFRERRRKEKYGDGPRRCEWPECTTILNSYNFNACCSVHHFDYVKKKKLKIDIGSAKS